jgi:uncharacterized damage-inducible protein DinB
MKPDYKVPVPEFYRDYVDSLAGENFNEVLKKQLAETTAWIRRIPEDKGDYAYAPGKWTVKEVLLHLIDAERVFAYRAMRFSRNDQTELPGFDENAYTPMSEAGRRTLGSIASEYDAVRKATIALFENLSETQLSRTGTGNGVVFSVILLGAAIAGHERHHRGVLKERYGI